MLKEKAKKGWQYFMIGLFLILAAGMQVKAAETESTTIGTLQELTKDAELKKEPDAEADTIKQLKQGEAVILESSDNGWSLIIYKGTEGYVINDALGIYNEEETLELEQEFQDVQEESIRMDEEFELLDKDKRSSTVWGVIITLLVAAVFGVGIFAALKQNKEGEKQ